MELMSVFAGMLRVDPVVPSARGRGYLLVPNIWWFGLGESSLYSKGGHTIVLLTTWSRMLWSHMDLQDWWYFPKLEVACHGSRSNVFDGNMDA